MAVEPIQNTSPRSVKPQDSQSGTSAERENQVKKVLKEEGFSQDKPETESEKQTFAEKLKAQLGSDASGNSEVNKVIQKLNQQFDAQLGQNESGFSNEEKVRLF